MRNRTCLSLAALAALALLGCGKSDAPTQPAAGAAHQAAEAQPADDGPATAEQVAKAARGNVSCPAKTSLPPRKQGAPVDDVVGVRPGMLWDEAANAVMCSNPLLVVKEAIGRGFEVQTYGQKIRQGFTARFAEPSQTSEQIMQEMRRKATARMANARTEDLQPGQVRWFVGTMGVPGQERVLSAARKERFAQGQAPTMDVVRQALIKKYGEPTGKTEYPHDGTLQLYWAYDPLGRRIGETSPLYHRCDSSADPDGAVNLNPACGVSVAAWLQGRRDNKALLDYMMAAVVDKGGGYKRITDTEQALQRADKQRRAAEVDKAGKNAKAPKL